MSDTTKPLSVIPLEEVVLGGFAQRLQQTFGCTFAVTNEHEKLRAIERLFEGKPVTYPYGFVKLNSFDISQQTYNPHYFVRHGIETFVVPNDTNPQNLYAVRCMPALFDVEIEYQTNVFMNARRTNPTENPTLSAVAFMRRWVMAARGGYTKFEITYGQLKFMINVILSPSISAPTKDNLVENEQVYVLTASAQIQGWVSEPILKKAGVVKQINMTAGVAAPKAGSAISLGTTFFARPTSSS